MITCIQTEYLMLLNCINNHVNSCTNCMLPIIKVDMLYIHVMHGHEIVLGKRDDA